MDGFRGKFIHFFCIVSTHSEEKLEKFPQFADVPEEKFLSFWRKVAFSEEKFAKLRVKTWGKLEMTIDHDLCFIVFVSMIHRNFAE